MLISLESFWTDRKEVLINVNSVDVCGSVPALGNFDCPCSEHSVVVGLRAVWGCWWRGRAAYTEAAAAAAALVAVAVPVGEDENEHRDQLLSVNIWGKYLDWWNCSGIVTSGTLLLLLILQSSTNNTICPSAVIFFVYVTMCVGDIHYWINLSMSQDLSGIMNGLSMDQVFFAVGK